MDRVGLDAIRVGACDDPFSEFTRQSICDLHYELNAVFKDVLCLSLGGVSVFAGLFARLWVSVRNPQLCREFAYYSCILQFVAKYQ